MSFTRNISIEDAASMEAFIHEQCAKNPELAKMFIELFAMFSGENKRLRALLDKALRKSFGQKSEKLNPNQLALFRSIAEEEAKQDAPSAGQDEPAEQVKEKQLRTTTSKKGKGHGRTVLSEKVPRRDNFIQVDEDDRNCARCNKEMPVFHYAESYRLDYIPARIEVICDKREKRSCKTCQDKVVTAKAPAKICERGLASEGLLAHILVNKYVDGMPLNRMVSAWHRQGVNIAKSTINDFVRQATTALGSLADYIAKQTLASYCISQDDTGINVLDKEHAKGSKRGHIWAFAGDCRWISYLYAPNWKGEHPRRFLQEYTGHIQGDGYAGINALFMHSDAKGPTRVGCAMHARRYFFDAFKSGDERAGVVLALYHEIYEVERLAKEERLCASERLALRQSRSLPLMQRLRAWLDKTGPLAPPKTELGKAVSYANKRWPELMVPFFDGRLEIDNGEAERRLRLLAMGRKSWLFAGSDAGGERTATALTVLGTALAHGVDPLAYVTYVLQRIASGIRGSDKAELLPGAWAKMHGQTCAIAPAVNPRLVS